MSLPAYVLGCVVVVAVLAPAVWVAHEVRRLVLPSWRGPWAALATVVGTSSAVLVAAEVVGTFGLLGALPLSAVSLAGWSGLAVALRRRPRRAARPEPAPVPVDPVALAGAVLGVVALGAQWLAWTLAALRQGGTGFDALVYHSTFSARFAQTGDVTRLTDVVPGEALTFYPANSELWHAIGMVAFHRDLLSPFVNEAALVVTLVAAWALGRRLGGAPAAVMAVALVAAVPYVAYTAPGSAFNDAPAVAALVVEAVLLTRVRDSPGAALFAALAAGTAAGTKLSFLAPALFVALSAIALAPRGRRLATSAGWAAVMLTTGGYWYVRNLVRVGNPLPGLALGIGRWRLPSPALPVDDHYGARLLTSFAPGRWHGVYERGLGEYFGRAWPGIVLAIVGGIVVALASPRSRWHRALGVVCIGALAAYVATPVTGDVVFFRFNIRYTIPAQAIALLLLATAPWLVGRWAQRGLVAAALVAEALAFPGQGVLRTGQRDTYAVPDWPGGTGHRVGAVVGAVAVCALAVAVWCLWGAARDGRSAIAGSVPTGERPLMAGPSPRRGRSATAGPLTRRGRSATAGPPPRRGPSPGPATAVGLAAVALVGSGVAGRGVSDRYLADRYRYVTGEQAPAWRWADGVHHARIAIAGFYLQFPLTGADLTNTVQYVGVRTPHHGFARAPSCAAWRAAVDAGHYRYVVTSRGGYFPPPGEPPEAGWTRSDPAARQIMRYSDTAVFELRGPLNPATCPAPSSPRSSGG